MIIIGENSLRVVDFGVGRGNPRAMELYHTTKKMNNKIIRSSCCLYKISQDLAPVSSCLSSYHPVLIHFWPHQEPSLFSLHTPTTGRLNLRIHPDVSFKGVF